MVEQQTSTTHTIAHTKVLHGDRASGVAPRPTADDSPRGSILSLWPLKEPCVLHLLYLGRQSRPLRSWDAVVAGHWVCFPCECSRPQLTEVKALGHSRAPALYCACVWSCKGGIAHQSRRPSRRVSAGATRPGHPSPSQRCHHVESRIGRRKAEKLCWSRNSRRLGQGSERVRRPLAGALPVSARGPCGTGVDLRYASLKEDAHANLLPETFFSSPSPTLARRAQGTAMKRPGDIL